MNHLQSLRIGWRRVTPMVLQAEASECGLACLAMVAQRFGQSISISELRRSFGASLKGATLKDLMVVADQIGFASRPLRLELEELSLLRTPCILHWDLSHFVVLVAVDKNSLLIHDPAIGVRRVPLAATSRHFTGVALELIPTGRFEPATTAPRVRASQLLGHILGVKTALLQLLAMALAIEVFAMIGPFFLAWIIDHALVSADRDLLLTMAIGFTLLLILRTAITGMRGWFLMGLKASLNVQSRANLFSHLLNLPTTYFEARHLGDIISRFGSQDEILKALTSDLVEVILDGLMAGLTLIAMFVFAPELATVVLVGALVYALIRWIYFWPLRQASSEAIIWSARRDSHFLESLRGISPTESR